MSVCVCLHTGTGSAKQLPGAAQPPPLLIQRPRAEGLLGARTAQGQGAGRDPLRAEGAKPLKQTWQQGGM